MITVYGDLATNHKGKKKLYEQLVKEVDDAGAVPKIQLYSAATFNRKWEPPEQFVASVFHPEDVDYIAPYAPLALKIASVESTHYQLIECCLRTNLPIIISTGGMNVEELLKLFDTVGDYQPGVCLMHCTALYPTLPEQANLYRLYLLAEKIDAYGLDWSLGWSCHIDPMLYYNEIPMMAAMAYVFGADQFELHVKPHGSGEKTLDEQVAVTPSLLKDFVDHCNEFETWEGDGEFVGPDREAVVGWRKRWQQERED